jgi:allene oxide cyclase
MNRKRNLVLGLLVVAAAAVTLASVAVASDGDKGNKGKGDGHGKKALVVIEHATSDTVIDNGDAGDSVGDLLAFGNDLFDKTDTTKVGTSSGSCVRTVVGVSWECSWTNTLKGGQIVVQGPFLDAGDSVLAITGGTGKYKNARGTMKLHALSATTFEFSFRINK